MGSICRFRKNSLNVHEKRTNSANVHEKHTFSEKGRHFREFCENGARFPWVEFVELGGKGGVKGGFIQLILGWGGGGKGVRGGP